MGKKIKIVADTNVYISALGWNGNERKVLNLSAEKIIECYTSLEILSELFKVLEYPKFAFNPEEKEDFITSLLLTLKIVEIKTTDKINIIKDDSTDNKFIHCALNCNADFIVSGDKHLLQLKSYKDIKIINASYLVKKILYDV